MPKRLEIAEAVREACLLAALAAYEEAGIGGLPVRGRPMEARLPGDKEPGS